MTTQARDVLPRASRTLNRLPQRRFGPLADDLDLAIPSWFTERIRLSPAV